MAGTVGGTVSELTGGKFANGAITGAFAYLYNQVMEGYAKQQALKQGACNSPTTNCQSHNALYQSAVDERTKLEAIESISPELEALGAFAGGGIGAVKNVSGIVFKSGHYSSRLAEKGLSVSGVEGVVAGRVNTFRSQLAVNAPFAERLFVDRIHLEYRGILRPNGEVNIGTIFPIK